MDKPKEEDYFYAHPQECLCEGTNCDLLGHGTQVKQSDCKRTTLHHR